MIEAYSTILTAILEAQEMVMERVGNAGSKEMRELVALEWPLLDKGREVIGEAMKMCGDRIFESGERIIQEQALKDLGVEDDNAPG